MRTAVAGLLLLIPLAGCDLSVDSDVEVEPGGVHDGASTVDGDVIVGRNAVVATGDLKTVNGRIQVAEGARVQDCSTIDGSIEIGSQAHTGDLSSVNGDLVLDRDARVEGDVRLVNGQIELREGVGVSGDVETVNGLIRMRRATVNGTVANYSGGIRLEDGSVAGSLRVRSPLHPPDAAEAPLIVIGAASEVRGPLRFDRPVRLYVHESAKIGPVSGAEVHRYAGDPPAAASGAAESG